MSTPQPDSIAAPRTRAWQAMLPQHLLRDYGMLLVLLGLIVFFSVVTYTEQHPTGADAGRQVAAQITAALGSETQVLVVARETVEDREFSSAAVAALQAAGLTVVGEVNGGPADVRATLTALSAQQRLPSALAVNDVSGRWTVYDAFPELTKVPRYQPTAYDWPNFLKRSNLLGVANQTAVYAIIAIGMTLVILTGGIDLSVGSLVALSAVVSALWLRDMHGGSQATIGGVLVAILLAVGVCTAVGGFSGLMITTCGLPPFIVTLGVMLMASGLAFRLSAGASIPELPRSFFWLGGGSTWGLPHPVWLMIGLYGLAHAIMSRTVFGRYVYAIGSNQEAARLAGVAVQPLLVVVYMVSAGLAGLVGVVQASMLQAGDPKFGLMYELEVIAAVVVGGTSLMGGRGKVLGTLIGAFIIAVIKNGMNLTNIDPFNQKIVLGAVLLLAVGLDTVKRQGWRPPGFRRSGSGSGGVNGGGVRGSGVN